MNTYAVTYVEVDASQTTADVMKTDMVNADDYEVGTDFVTFVGDNHQVVAAYALRRVVSIATTSGA
jgi:hypothetical protein